MSATLRPFDVTKDVLGLEDVASLAYGMGYPGRTDGRSRSIRPAFRLRA